MIHRSAYLIVLLVGFGFSAIAFGHKTHNSKDKGWISLFNGKNLDGWKVGKNASTFSVEDGTIKVAGPRHICSTKGMFKTTISRILSSRPK